MHIDLVPNRGGTPTVLLRKSYRDGGKTKKQTVANLSELGSEQIEQMRAILRGERLLPAAQVLGLGAVTARELYATLDWLGGEQIFIENTLARRHLRDGALLLYDVTSTFWKAAIASWHDMVTVAIIAVTGRNW